MRLGVRLPARCRAGGNYGALRGWRLIEPRPGGETNWAPEPPDGSIALSEPIPRG